MRVENGFSSIPLVSASTGQTAAEKAPVKPSSEQVVKVKQQVDQQGMKHEGEKPVDESEVIKAIEKANRKFKTMDRRLEFSIHETTKQIMVKVINTEDDSVVREIPSEKVLDMVAHMWEVAGILVDEKR